MTDLRRYAPATARNREPILQVLRRHLPPRGVVVEIASGTGEHIVHFARALGPDLEFQPTDLDPSARASIDAWSAASGVSNVRRAIALDAATAEWSVTRADAVLCINMIHISSWPATVGLMRGAARVLPVGGVLYLYGPYRREGRHTAPSNVQFDAQLRATDPAWGVRDLEEVVALATSQGFGAPVIEDMPANNLSVIFRRGS
jgi:SAM-dependent methyltransferase